MKKRWNGILALLLAAALLCAGCGGKKEEPAPPEKQPAAEQPAEQPAEKPAEKPAEAEEEPELPSAQMPEEDVKDPDVVPEVERLPAKEPPAFTFADVADLEFFFSSGAGAWCTVLYINADGTFEGNYHDTDMGDMGEEYPNGTLYLSNFSGAFTQPERVNGQTWKFSIAELNYERPPEETEIVDGVRQIWAEAYGLAGAEELYLFLPDTPLTSLPEDYLMWVGYYDLSATEETALPYYGLYNVTMATGFSSYGAVITDGPETPAEGTAAAESLAAAEQAAAAIEQQLLNDGTLTQTEMNDLSAQLFAIWDKQLNQLWSELKASLDEDTFRYLSDQQLDWIAQKESSVEAAGAEYEGGSMYALVTNREAAAWTKARVYDLLDYLP